MFKDNKSKDIDLLAQYHLATKKVTFVEKYSKYLILPIVLVLVIGSSFGYLKIKQNGYEDDIEELKQEIAVLEKEHEDSDYDEKYQSLQELQKEVSRLKKVNKNIASYPVLTENIYSKCFEVTNLGTITSSSFDQTTGKLTLIIETSDVTFTKKIVKNLMDLNLFSNVRYSGYREVEKNVNNSIYMHSTTPEKLVLYQMTVVCSIGGDS